MSFNFNLRFLSQLVLPNFKTIEQFFAPIDFFEIGHNELGHISTFKLDHLFRLGLYSIFSRWALCIGTVRVETYSWVLKNYLRWVSFWTYVFFSNSYCPITKCLISKRSSWAPIKRGGAFLNVEVSDILYVPTRCVRSRKNRLRRKAKIKSSNKYILADL